MINNFYNNFQNCHFKPLSHLPKSIFRVTGFEPVIFYAQDKHDTITLYPIFIKIIKHVKKYIYYYVNKIKKAIIKANKATASVKANPKIV